MKTCYKRNFTFLASICSRGDFLSSALSETSKTSLPRGDVGSSAVCDCGI